MDAEKTGQISGMMRWMVRRLVLYQDDGMDGEKAGFISG
jgi:hypothetical protein